MEELFIFGQRYGRVIYFWTRIWKSYSFLDKDMEELFIFQATAPEEGLQTDFIAPQSRAHPLKIMYKQICISVLAVRAG